MIEMQSIIDMNDYAVDFVSAGQLQEATSILSVALTSLRLATDCSSAANDQIKGKRQMLGRQSLELQKASAFRKRSFANPVSELKSDEDFIYCSPIPSNGLPEDETLDIYSLTVIVVFNLALSHHLQAKQNDDGSLQQKEHLKTALKFYELSFQMQLKGDCQLHLAQILALVNNCGQIYKQLNHRKKAQRFLQHMLATLFVVIQNGEIAESEALDGFLWNATRLILKDPNVAAAA